jgi:hypothetical protein
VRPEHDELPLRGVRVLLLAPGPSLGGRPESPDAQQEVWEGILAAARAVLAAGGSIEVEGDVYAGLLVGLVAEEYLERAPAEGERSEATTARPESRAEARVTLRVDSEPDLPFESSVRPLIELGLVRVETDRGAQEVPASLQVDAVVAFGESASRSSQAVLRRRGRRNTLLLTMPITPDERRRRSGVVSNDGRAIVDAAERAVEQARASWRERRASDQERLESPVDHGFREDRWLDQIPHALYAQLLIERLLRDRDRLDR